MDGEQARNAGPERPRRSLVIRIAEMLELIRSRVFSLGAILLITLPVRFERLESSSSVQESPFTRGAALLQAMSSSNQDYSFLRGLFQVSLKEQHRSF